MRAWAVLQQGAPLECIELPTPDLSGTEVMVAVACCGLCHSDLHTWEGTRDLGRRGIVRRPNTGPQVIGHEIVGRVTAWGPEATGVGVGDLRIVFPWLGCGQCEECLAGLDNMCTVESRSIGFARPGGFGEYVVVPHPRYLVDPGTISPALAATYACSGLTVLSALRKLLPLGPGIPLVLIGAGGLGLQSIAMARALGHETIIVVDQSDSKRAAALAEGATAFVHATGDGMAEAIIQAAGGKVRAILDLVNNSATSLAAFDALRKGGKMVQVGLFGGELVAPLPILTGMGLTVQGSITGSLQDLRDVVALAQSGKLRAMPVAELPMTEVNSAIERLHRGEVQGRLVLRNG